MFEAYSCVLKVVFFMMTEQTLHLVWSEEQILDDNC
jgi:hypothetical protein